MADELLPVAEAPPPAPRKRRRSWLGMSLLLLIAALLLAIWGGARWLDSDAGHRFIIRQIDPVRQWKLSPMDLESLDRWEAYTAAKEEMFARTDTKTAPWITIKTNDKKRARLNAMRYFLSQFEYDDKDHAVVGEADPLIVQRGKSAVGD